MDGESLSGKADECTRGATSGSDNLWRICQINSPFSGNNYLNQSYLSCHSISVHIGQSANLMFFVNNKAKRSISDLAFLLRRTFTQCSTFFQISITFQLTGNLLCHATITLQEVEQRFYIVLRFYSQTLFKVQSFHFSIIMFLMKSYNKS